MVSFAQQPVYTALLGGLWRTSAPAFRLHLALQSYAQLVLIPHPTLLLSPDDFEALCNVLQRPSYGVGRLGSLGAPFEYGGGEFMPYGPDVYDPLAQPGPLLPSYGALPREPLYGPSSPYEAAGLDDAPYSNVQLESPAEDPQRGHQPRSPPDSDWHYQSRGRGHSYPERPSRASEDYREWVTKGVGGAIICMFAKQHVQVEVVMGWKEEGPLGEEALRRGKQGGGLGPCQCKREAACVSWSVISRPFWRHWRAPG